MAKLYSYTYMSLDGVMSSPETWTPPYFGKELQDPNRIKRASSRRSRRRLTAREAPYSGNMKHYYCLRARSKRERKRANNALKLTSAQWLGGARLQLNAVFGGRHKEEQVRRTWRG